MISTFLYELTDLLIIQNVAFKNIFMLLLYKLPNIISQSFPMAILFATIMGIGKLKSNNEFIALRMGGISLYRLIIPLIIFGLIISITTFIINEKITPWSNHKSQNIIRKNIIKDGLPDIEENVFFRGNNQRLFYVKEYDKKLSLLKKVIIYELNDKKNKYPQIITSETAKIDNNTWKLKNGIIHSYKNNGELNLETKFNEMDIKLSKDITDMIANQKTPSEMNRKELKKEINLFLDSGLKVNSLLVEYHLKLATPFMPFIFILIGTPLSLTKNNNKTFGIVITIIVLFLYYFFQSVFRSLGRNQVISPLISAWSTNILFGLLGIIFIKFKRKIDFFITNITN